MAKGSNITDAELKAGDKRTRPVRSIVSGDIIIGKVYPGPRTLQEWNEVTDPDG